MLLGSIRERVRLIHTVQVVEPMIDHKHDGMKAGINAEIGCDAFESSGANACLPFPAIGNGFKLLWTVRVRTSTARLQGP